MEQPLIIADLDSATVKWIEQESQRSGLPVEAVVRQLIYRGLQVERQQARGQVHHDLDSLAGTWNAEEADEFRRALADLNEIDPLLWQ